MTKFKQWILSENPTSNWQSTCSKYYIAFMRLIANPMALFGLMIILSLVLVAIFASILSPHDPLAADLTKRLLPPGSEYLLGTDNLGRDILSRIIHGSRITLVVVSIVVITAAPVGLLIGTISGYFGGWIDTFLMRITDVFLAFPKLILALAFVSALGVGIENAILAIAITAWPPYARIARAETITVRRAEYIDATRLQGASWYRIVLKHIVPMCLSSVIIRVTLDMAGIILTAAGLGFLGLGARPPSPEWGLMIASGRQFILDQWWVATIPGICIFLVSLGFNLLGDGMRDVLDPKSNSK